MSDVIPVAAQHPILLDVVTKETMMRTGEPMAPLHFRGFRLHTVWTQQPGGDLVHQIAFPPFPRQGWLIHAGIRAREVSPGPDAGPKDGNKPQVTV